MSENNEWYTPQRYLQAARDVMGGEFDLDPASCVLANQFVQAKHFYTQDDNGLSHEWIADRLWLNPPYNRVNGNGASQIRLFTAKLCESYRSGRVKQAMLLTTVQTSSKWFQWLWEYSLCFTDHRVHFIKMINEQLQADSRHSHMFGTVFVYFGPHTERFAQVFQQFGHIVLPSEVSSPPVFSSFTSLWQKDSPHDQQYPQYLFG